MREPKHSEALLIPLPPISRLPFLHQKDEALARAGCFKLNVLPVLQFLILEEGFLDLVFLQGPLFTCDSGEVNCPSKGKKELASSGENR